MTDRRPFRWYIVVFLVPAVLVYTAIMIVPLFGTLQLGDSHMGATIATAMFAIILVGVSTYLFGVQRRLRRYQ